MVTYGDLLKMLQTMTPEEQQQNVTAKIMREYCEIKQVFRVNSGTATRLILEVDW